MSVINRESPSLIGGALPAIDGGKPGSNVAAPKFINTNSDNPVVSSVTNGTYINANGDSQKL